jgi:hypothetical protein
MKKAFSLILVLVTMGMVGCSTPQRRLEPETIASLTNGVTTWQEVHKSFGSPESLLTGKNGKTLARYNFLKQKPRMLEPTLLEVRTLSLLFTDTLVLERKLYSTSAPTVQQGFLNASLGKPIRREEITEFLKPGTLREKIIERFGEPFVEYLNLDGETVSEWVAVKVHDPFTFTRNRSQSLTVRFDPGGVMIDFTVEGTLEPDR